MQGNIENINKKQLIRKQQENIMKKVRKLKENNMKTARKS